MRWPRLSSAQVASFNSYGRGKETSPAVTFAPQTIAGTFASRAAHTRYCSNKLSQLELSIAAFDAQAAFSTAGLWRSTIGHTPADLSRFLKP